jgi:hypothetical protein
MSATTGLSPQNPTKYRGPRDYLVTTVTRNRRPLPSDFRQPETGQNYPVTTVWQVSKNPTTGIEGELWFLAKIVANVATWILVTGGSIGPIDKFTVDNATFPGITTVTADFSGNININGRTVPAGSIPVDTRSIALSQYQIEVQITQAIAASDATKIGLAAFNQTQFVVDANGFVSLLGGGAPIEQVTVQAHTAPGTNPVVANSGNININGSIVAAHAIPLQSDSLAANTFNIEAQFASAQAASSGTNAGMASFNSSFFTVDANGYVGLVGGFPAINQVGVQAFTGPGTNPVTASATGQINVNGTIVASHSIPIRTDSLAVNTYNVEVQYSSAAATSIANNAGMASFSTTYFTVDANGFVTVTGPASAVLLTNSAGVGVWSGTMTNGQVIIGSTGATPIANTLTAGAGIAIGNGPGTITIAATGAGFAWSDQAVSFNAAKENGYFITAVATATLPLDGVSVEGDTIAFIVDTASNLTIQASAGQTIRLSTKTSTVAGTLTNTQRGDSIELVYRKATLTWIALDANGGWNAA